MQKAHTVSANEAYVPIEEINIKQVNDLNCDDYYFAGNDVYMRVINLVWEMTRRSPSKK